MTFMAFVEIVEIVGMLWAIFFLWDCVVHES